MTSRAFAALMALAPLAQACARADAQPLAPVSPPPTPTAAVTAVTPAASTPPPPAIRNVVLISIDSLRADMPWAGYARPIAPNLTAFAARSVQYTHAYALSSYTSQSVGGFLGGRVASELPRDREFFLRYRRDDLFFPQVLQRAHVRTLAAHAHFYFRRGYSGFDRGFDQYAMVPTTVDFSTDRDVTGDRHEPLAEQLLGDPANTSGPFFAWFHFMDAHDLYLPHATIRPYGRLARDRYDAEVTWTDQWVGRLLAFIAHQAWAPQTAIIITADHGEAFGEHGAFRHGFELWQPLVRVPWMFYLPGVPPRVIDVNRSHLDLAPTILSLLGVPVPPEFRGMSLVPEVLGRPAPERDVMVDLAETTANRQRRALIHGRYKFLTFDHDARAELFDVDADPGELHSLRTTATGTFADMQARYRAAEGSLQEFVVRVPAATEAR